MKTITPGNSEKSRGWLVNCLKSFSEYCPTNLLTSLEGARLTLTVLAGSYLYYLISVYGGDINVYGRVMTSENLLFLKVIYTLAKTVKINCENYQRHSTM